MPAARSPVLAIDVVDHLRTGERRHGRVQNERAQQSCEGLMLGFVEMALAAEKDDAMAQQGIADHGHRLGRQVVQTRSGRQTSPTFRWRAASSICAP
jgi:hypothetical protein